MSNTRRWLIFSAIVVAFALFTLLGFAFSLDSPIGDNYSSPKTDVLAVPTQDLIYRSFGPVPDSPALHVASLLFLESFFVHFQSFLRRILPIIFFDLF